MRIMVTVHVISMSLLLCVSTLAADVDTTIEGSIFAAGSAHAQTMTHVSIAKQPSWSPLKEECPLSPKKAAQLAAIKLKTDLPNVTYLKLSSISLEKVPSSKDKWYYIVNFFKDPESMEGDYANILVCLDGFVPDFKKVEE